MTESHQVTADERRQEGLLPAGVTTPAGLQPLLAAAGYLTDLGTATAAYLAMRLARPLFLEGEPGTGKTSLALALAQVLHAPLIRLQCYEGIDVTQALYDWDFPRQLLHLKVAELAGRTAAGQVEEVEAELWSERFLLARPLLQALRTSPCVLLVDEVDRADDEFEAYLLQVLSDYAVSIPELGTITAVTPPVVVLTGNRTRDVSDALKRRCLYHWLDHPGFAREVEILALTVPEASAELTQQVVRATQFLRGADLAKPPGVAETIDWTKALVALDTPALDAAAMTATLGALLKHREDALRVRQSDMTAALGRAIGFA